MICEETYTLSNGMKIPKLGLGTWEIPVNTAADAVKKAIQSGYRLIDTAQGYENERGVGKGVRTCGLSRSKLFVTTKLQAFYKTYRETAMAIDQSLFKSGLDYFDLMLIHAPQPWTDFRSENHYYEGNLEAWRAMEQAVKDGKLRAIGVSNFEKEDIDNILDNGTIQPVVNQILTHISNTPMALIDYCKSKDIVTEAYSPIGHGVVLSNPAIKKIADKYHVTTAQLCIRYCLELGMVALPKAENPEHMKQNTEVDFTIVPEDMQELIHFNTIENYGDYAAFPVFGGTMNKDGSCVAGNFRARN